MTEDHAQAGGGNETHPAGRTCRRFVRSTLESGLADRFGTAVPMPVGITG
jgi:hypothetical protein